jgi:sec-independent protein translocase protein TatC
MSLLDRLFQLREETDQSKPFLQHLEELRWTLVKMAIALVSCMMASLLFQRDLIHILEHPLNQIDPTLPSKLRNLGVADPFSISFQIAFYAGLILAFPFLFYFLMQFILPALSRKEKKVLFPAIAVGFGLFLGGVAFAYFWIVPETLKFFYQWSKSLNFAPDWTVREYFSFVTQMTVTLGLAFELPVVVMALVYLGIVTFPLLNRTRPFAYLLVLVFAAVIAPTPDVLTFLSIGLPMCALYEACIWLAWMVDRRKAREESAAPQLPDAGVN